MCGLRSALGIDAPHTIVPQGKWPAGVVSPAQTFLSACMVFRTGPLEDEQKITPEPTTAQGLFFASVVRLPILAKTEDPLTILRPNRQLQP